jgi:hypothetical protein
MSKFVRLKEQVINLEAIARVDVPMGEPSRGVTVHFIGGGSFTVVDSPKAQEATWFLSFLMLSGTTTLPQQ